MFTANDRRKIFIIGVSIILSLFLYGLSQSIYPSGNLRIIRLEQWYGFVAIWCLFAAVMAGPLYRVYPNFPGKNFYRSCLGGLGTSAFYFGLLHGSINFFDLLGGFKGLKFLGPFHVAAVVLGFITLLIITAMAATSFAFVVQYLGSRWKIIHRFVYLALATVAAHVIIMGTHFHDLSSPAALFTFVWFMIILSLYAVSTRNFLYIRNPQTSKMLINLFIVLAVALIMYGIFILHRAVATFHMN